jgi:TIR domain-containing protein
MSRLFISCNNQDFVVGKKLEKALIKLGHVMTLPVDAKPAGRWEKQLLRGLHTADAFISLLTPSGMNSSWVVGQTGMAISCEYTKNMLVLPVCPRDEIPNFAAAFHCFWLSGGDHAAIEKLAADLDQAIVAHRAAQPPRIFISHRHKDARIARKVIDLMKSAFHIQTRDVRCTSVPGYKLATGSQSADSLQNDLNGAEIVMGLIGPDTSESDYVLFELGASWGLRKPTFPLRIGGATFEHIPEVLREKSSLSLDDVTQCLQLVEDIHRASSLSRKKTSGTGKGSAVVRRQAEHLARVAKS